MPKRRRSTKRVSGEEITFTLSLPRALLETCISLTAGDQIHLSANLVGGHKESLSVIGEKEDESFQLTFKDNQAKLKDYLKKAWNCELQQIPQNKPRPSLSAAGPSVSADGPSVSADGPSVSAAEPSVSTAEPADEPPKKRPRGRPRKSESVRPTQVAPKDDPVVVVERLTPSPQKKSQRLKSSAEVSLEIKRQEVQNPPDLATPIKTEKCEKEQEEEDEEMKTEEEEDEHVDDFIVLYDAAEETEQTPSKPLSCFKCPKTFRSPKWLEKHLQYVHLDGNTPKRVVKRPGSKITEQKKSFLIKANAALCVKKGIIESDEAQENEATGCVICKRVFKGSLCVQHCMRHWREVHKITSVKYHSIVSANTEEERQQLIKHVLETSAYHSRRISGGEENKDMVQCPGCQRFYKGWSCTLKHIQTVHKNEAGYQDLLKEFDEQKANFFLSHVKNHEELRLVCRYCQAVRFGRRLLYHLKTAHEQESDIKEAMAEAKIKADKMMKNREDTRKKTFVNREKEMGKEYCCKLCLQKFSSRRTRDRHYHFKCQMNDNRRQWVYCSCGREFANLDSLKKHKETCQRKKGTFVCDICGKIYQNASSFYLHKNTAHYKVVRHRCPICNKGFFSKQHMDVHLAVHTDQRNYSCDLCMKTYKNKSAIQKHKALVHFNRYRYHCDTCGHGMQKFKYLEAHRCGRVRRTQASSTDASNKSDQDQKEAAVIPVSRESEKKQNLGYLVETIVYEEMGEKSQPQEVVYHEEDKNVVILHNAGNVVYQNMEGVETNGQETVVYQNPDGSIYQPQEGVVYQVYEDPSVVQVYKEEQTQQEDRPQESE